MEKKSKLTSKKIIFGCYAYCTIITFKPLDLLNIYCFHVKNSASTKTFCRKKGAGKKHTCSLPPPQLLKVGALPPPPTPTSKVGYTFPLHIPTWFQSPLYNCKLLIYILFKVDLFMPKIKNSVQKGSVVVTCTCT